MTDCSHKYIYSHTEEDDDGREFAVMLCSACGKTRVMTGWETRPDDRMDFEKEFSDSVVFRDTGDVEVLKYDIATNEFKYITYARVKGNPFQALRTSIVFDPIGVRVIKPKIVNNELAEVMVSCHQATTESGLIDVEFEAIFELAEAYD